VRWFPLALVALGFGLLASAPVVRAGEGDEEPDPAAIAKPGVHEAGRWSYELRVTNEGTKSEGTAGTLLYDGVVLPGVKGSLYRTPWGDFHWVENVRLWGAHGWMPAVGIPERPVLPDPSTFAKTTLRTVLLDDGEPPEGVERPPAWAEEAMRAKGIAPCRLLGQWVALGADPLVLHDSKHYGEASLVLEPVGDEATTLRVRVDGTEGDAVVLARRHGAHAFVHRTLGERFGSIDLYVALEVEVRLEAPADESVFPRPLDGPGGGAPAAPAPAPRPRPPLALEEVHVFRYEREALVFGVMNAGYTNASSFQVLLTREEGSRVLGVALVRVAPDEGKMVPQSIEVRFPLRELGLERSVPLRLLNPFGAVSD